MLCGMVARWGQFLRWLPQPIQNYENKKEGSNRVTWDELVHVRTIEPCPGKGQAKWHHADQKHSRQRKEHHWEESNQTNFYNSVTSPIL